MLLERPDRQEDDGRLGQAIPIDRPRHQVDPPMGIGRFEHSSAHFQRITAPPLGLMTSPQ